MQSFPDIQMVLGHMTVNEEADEDGRRINISVEKSWLIGVVAALSIAMLGQFIGAIWWAASTSMRLTQIELRLASVETQLSVAVTERIASAAKGGALDEKVLDMTAKITELSSHLSSVESYLHNQVTNQRR